MVLFVLQHMQCDNILGKNKKRQNSTVSAEEVSKYPSRSQEWKKWPCSSRQQYLESQWYPGMQPSLLQISSSFEFFHRSISCINHGSGDGKETFRIRFCCYWLIMWFKLDINLSWFSCTRIKLVCPCLWDQNWSYKFRMC